MRLMVYTLNAASAEVTLLLDYKELFYGGTSQASSGAAIPRRCQVASTRPGKEKEQEQRGGQQRQLQRQRQTAVAAASEAATSTGFFTHPVRSWLLLNAKKGWV